MRPKLNGWKRIGIVASLLWVFIAGAWTFGAEQTSDIRIATTTNLSCENTPEGYVYNPKCDQQASSWLENQYSNEWLTAAIVALVPAGRLGAGVSNFILRALGWSRIR
ncbi:MAG: hypothetical protein ACRD4X_18655 [Candidatus Acidiferrales bacterium]